MAHHSALRDGQAAEQSELETLLSLESHIANLERIRDDLLLYAVRSGKVPPLAPRYVRVARRNIQSSFREKIRRICAEGDWRSLPVLWIGVVSAYLSLPLML